MQQAGFGTAAELGRAAKVDNSRIGQYLALSRVPILENGEWSQSVIRLANTLRALPEDLFPQQHYREALKISSAEADVSLEDISALLPAPDDGDPQAVLERKEKMAALTAALGSLSPRHEKVLRLRFGLDDGDEMTLRDAGKRLSVTQERTRQMELSALRKLRKAYEARRT